jgi:hypothetical protein
MKSGLELVFSRYCKYYVPLNNTMWFPGIEEYFEQNIES